MLACTNCARKVWVQKNYQKGKHTAWFCYRCHTEFDTPENLDERSAHGRWQIVAIPKPDIALYERTILGIKDPVAQALTAVLYLTGARISEIINKYETRWKERVPTKILVQEGLRKHQIKTLEDGSLLFENLPVQKRRKNKIVRQVPTSTKDFAIIQIIQSYIKQLNDDDILFDIDYNTAYGLIKKHTGMHPHFLRHICVSIRVTRDGFNELHLKHFIGWSNTAPASRYTHLDIEELKNLLQQ